MPSSPTLVKPRATSASVRVRHHRRSKATLSQASRLRSLPSISPKPIAGPQFDPGDVHLRLAPNQKCKGPFSLHKRPLSRCPRLAQPVSHVPPTSLSLASVACRQFSARFYRFRCPTLELTPLDQRYREAALRSSRAHLDGLLRSTRLECSTPRTNNT